MPIARCCGEHDHLTQFLQAKGSLEWPSQLIMAKALSWGCSQYISQGCWSPLKACMGPEYLLLVAHVPGEFVLVGRRPRFLSSMSLVA